MVISELLTRLRGCKHQYAAPSDLPILHLDQYSQRWLHLNQHRGSLLPVCPCFPQCFLYRLSSGVNTVLLGDMDAQLVMSPGELLHTWAGDRSWLASSQVEKDSPKPETTDVEKCEEMEATGLINSQFTPTAFSLGFIPLKWHGGLKHTDRNIGMLCTWQPLTLTGKTGSNTQAWAKMHSSSTGTFQLHPKKA